MTQRPVLLLLLLCTLIFTTASRSSTILATASQDRRQQQRLSTTSRLPIGHKHHRHRPVGERSTPVRNPSSRRRGGASAQPPSSVGATVTVAGNGPAMKVVGFEGGGNRRWSPAVVNGVKNFMASGLAAACAKTLLAPFDTIKTMQQQVVRDSGAGEAALGLAEAARVIMRRPRGFLELYAGLGVAALGSMPSVGLYFGVYSYSKSRLSPFYQRSLAHYNSTSPAIVRILTVGTSAAIGNTVASFSRVPHEVVKQKLQTGRYSSTRAAVVDMVRNGGLRSFFPAGGVTIQMVRDIPYAIVTLLVYEGLRDHWVNRSNGGDVQDRTKGGKPVAKPWRDMVAGGVSGGIGSYVTNPMDVVKTRLQTDSGMYGGDVWRCVRATYAEGGARAFMRGSVPRLLHKVPANMVFFLSYEFFRRLFKVSDDASGGGGSAVDAEEEKLE